MGLAIPIINLHTNPMRQLGVFLIQSKLLIAFAALVLTLATQVQMGQGFGFKPYLLMVFFATFLVYNLTRLVVLQFYKMPLEHASDQWVNRHQIIFYGTFAIAFVGLIMVFFFIDKNTFLYILPLMLLALFYALPFLRIKHYNLNLRRIPFLKIVLIVLIWGISTALIPVFQLQQNYQWWIIVLLLFQRLAFIGALALLFDIRDMQADASQGLLTLPLRLGEVKTLKLSNACMVIFFMCSVLFCLHFNQLYMMPSACLTLIILGVIINNKSIKKHSLYYDLYLDGTMLIHGLSIILAYKLFN